MVLKTNTHFKTTIMKIQEINKLVAKFNKSDKRTFHYAVAAVGGGYLLFEQDKSEDGEDNDNFRIDRSRFYAELEPLIEDLNLQLDALYPAPHEILEDFNQERFIWIIQKQVCKMTLKVKDYTSYEEMKAYAQIVVDNLNKGIES